MGGKLELEYMLHGKVPIKECQYHIIRYTRGEHVGFPMLLVGALWRAFGSSAILMLAVHKSFGMS